MSQIKIEIPDIGDFKEVEIIEILMKVGSIIEIDQSLLTVESDKVSMEIPSSHAGVIKELKVKVGDKVSKGSFIALLETVDNTFLETTISSTTKSISSVPIVSNNDFSSITLSDIPSNKLHASPSVRKFAREFDVDLNLVIGSGPKGRILQEDIQKFIKNNKDTLIDNTMISTKKNNILNFNFLQWPSLDFSKFGSIELQPLSRIQKISGLNLHRNSTMIPHVTQFGEVDVTELEEFRKSVNESHAKIKSTVKLTMLTFVIKASITVLQKFPTFNSSLDASGENLILKKYYNIGFATDTSYGLVVPVIKNVDQKRLNQIAQEIINLSSQAREGKLQSIDVQGGTFTISSLGGIGGTAFTPIVNAPEVAILGLSRLIVKPVWDGKQFSPRLILPTSLSYDHRVIDGTMGARFSIYLAEILSDLRNLLL